ncbi:MAG: threonylcarbamoyl-AMP synthase [Paramuribaculum sp.]|nr:threonylcarbamoyl-AMP synthase [Paramuribaculum sp.]
MSRFLKTDIDAAIDCLKKGGIILYPTDTVWGIGCDAANENAVRRIFELKRRAEAKSMISLVADSAQLERFTDGLPEIAFQLIEEAVTPLTIIVDHPVGIAPSMLAPDGSAGFRVSDEPFNRELCRRLRRPLVSTSANISGQPTPRFFGEIPKEIIDAVDYVAIYRRDDTEPRRPSAIIKISDDASFKIIRK